MTYALRSTFVRNKTPQWKGLKEKHFPFNEVSVCKAFANVFYIGIPVVRNIINVSTYYTIIILRKLKSN